MARVLFLHGASSSGKTTLAAAVRKLSSSPWLHLSIDHLRDSGVWDPQAYPDWSTARPDFFSGFHRAVAGFATAGNDVLLEHILDTEGWHQELQGLLHDSEVFFVGLHTGLACLQERETRRGDRVPGSAETDFHTVHAGLSYDLELDGSTHAHDNARTILTALETPPARSRFFNGSHQTSGTIR